MKLLVLLNCGVIWKVLEFIKVIEIWIDDQGRMRRTVMSLLIGDEMQISTDMRLTDIDSRIIIEEPSDYQDLR